MPRARLACLALSFCLVVGVLGCAEPAPDGYRAEIRRTSFGVAHIRADDLASLGFGEGYAQAEDHLCTLADQVIKARGERARFFGRGDDDAHLWNDVVMRGLRVPELGAADLAGESAEIQGWYRGFAAGYNHYLAETGVAQVPGWCRGAAWVRPISAEDLGAYLRQITMVVPRLTGPIASAAPPHRAPDPLAPQAPSTSADAGSTATHLDLEALSAAMPTLAASNGWALGADWTESGRGMLVANPHYPWVGANRFWEKHLTVPGDLDVYGVGLIGVPGVAIGFNRHVAWTHTVSAGQRLTFMRLDLVPGDPTRYRYGDEERAMEERVVEVAVRDGDGNIGTHRHSVWLSHHGPIVRFGGLEWTASHAFAVRDANQDNDEARRQWLAMNRADGMDALQAAHAEHQGMPWVNTIAASHDGRAWYTDSAATPKLSEATLDAWRTAREEDPVTRSMWHGVGVVLLDGSDPAASWQSDPAARDAGVIAFADMPQLERRDYVWNANDSFWLAHAAAPIEGDFSPLHGEQRTVLSLRSRNNEVTLAHRSPDAPAGDDRRFGLEELAAALLSNRSYAAEMLKPELVRRCRATPTVAIDGIRHDLEEACDVLAAWDDRFDVDSRGAVLFREWISQYATDDLRDAGRLFAEGFDPARPIATPSGLAPAGDDGDLALRHLAEAAALLASRDLPLDVPLGTLQFHDKGERRIAVHGGDGDFEGLLNLQRAARNRTTLEPMATYRPVEGSRFLTEDGYPVAHGSSFVLVLDFADDGPRAQGILTYSQSGDPASPHFADQTDLFAAKQLRPVLFTDDEIAADVQRTITVSAPE